MQSEKVNFLTQAYLCAISGPRNNHKNDFFLSYSKTMHFRRYIYRIFFYIFMLALLEICCTCTNAKVKGNRPLTKFQSDT